MTHKTELVAPPRRYRVAGGDRTVATDLEDDVEPDLEVAGRGLDEFVPGLRDAAIDLFDAVHDKADELGPARPDLLTTFREQLGRVWDRTPETERPLLVLDVLRAVLTTPRF